MTSLVIGPPGCGKTTEIAKLVSKAVSNGRRPMVCSLTKAAAAEAAGRIHGASVGTMHSHALRALGFPPLAVGGAVKDFNGRHPTHALSEGRGGGNVDEPQEEAGEGGGRTDGDKQAALYHLLRAQCIDRRAWPIECQRWARAWEAWKDHTGRYDFSDLIERATAARPILTGAGDHPDVIMVDEAQDSSRLELDMIKAWALRAGSLVIVGDPWQALYVWRGAHPEMFSSEKVDSRRVLSQSYRVPVAVHAVALGWIRQLSDYGPIHYEPRGHPGHAGLLDATCGPDAVPVVDAIERHLQYGKSVMLAGSCAFHLRPAIAELRSRGVPFAQPWSQTRGEWNPLGARRGSVTMAQRLAAFVKPCCAAGNRPTVDDRPPGGAGTPPAPPRGLGGAPDHFPDVRKMVDDDDAGSFDFGANVSDNSNRGGDDASFWSPTDVYRWSAVLKATGLMRHGAKSRLKEHADTGDSAISQTVVDDGHLAAWFETNIWKYIRAISRGEVPQDDAVDWWRDHLLSSHKAAAAYPSKVLDRQGLSGITDQPRCYVGSIHSFKGTEADVVIIYPDLSPQGWNNWQSEGVGRDAVIRQFYVAMTRARESLYICRPASDLTSPAWEWVA